jgi:hypothetical protein
VVDLVLILLVVAIPVIWISAIVSASRFSEAAYHAVGRNKLAVILLLLITSFVGGIYYFAVIKRELKPHRDAEPTLPAGRYIDPSQFSPPR